MTKKRKKNTRLGKCYELAGKYILNSQNMSTKIVHGVLYSPFPDVKHPILPHAWIEEDGEVYDLVMGNRYPREMYYSIFSAEIKRVLRKETFRKEVLQSGYWDLKKGGDTENGKGKK